MAYLIQEIFWYLAIAFVLGALTAWLVCRQNCARKIAALKSNMPDDKPGTPVETIEGIGAGFGRR